MSSEKLEKLESSVFGVTDLDFKTIKKDKPKLSSLFSRRESLVFEEEIGFHFENQEPESTN